MKTAAEKRTFASIVKEKATKSRNIRKNLAMLSNRKEPGSIQLEQRLLQWTSLVRVIVKRMAKILLADNNLWWFLFGKKYRLAWISQVISILFKRTLRTNFVSGIFFLQKLQYKLSVYHSRLTRSSMNGHRLQTHLAHILTSETLQPQLSSNYTLCWGYPGFNILIPYSILILLLSSGKILAPPSLIAWKNHWTLAWVYYPNCNWFPSDTSAAWDVGWARKRTNYFQSIQRPSESFFAVQRKFSTNILKRKLCNQAESSENIFVRSSLQPIWVSTQDALRVLGKKPRKRVHSIF